MVSSGPGRVNILAMSKPIITICAGVALAIALAGCRASRGDDQGHVEVTCGAELGLEPKDNVRKDWNGDTRSWWVETTNDTLRLVRKGRCGDECKFEEEIVLTDLAAACPQLVRASITRRDAGSPVPATVKEARRGTLEIQDWLPARGTISGRLTAEFSATFFLNNEDDNLPMEPRKEDQ